MTSPADKHCNKKMSFVWCWDDPRSGHAHNVYGCETCGAVAIERVWDNAGVTTVESSGAVGNSHGASEVGTT